MWETYVMTVAIQISLMNYWQTYYKGVYRGKLFLRNCTHVRQCHILYKQWHRRKNKASILACVRSKIKKNSLLRNCSFYLKNVIVLRFRRPMSKYNKMLYSARRVFGNAWVTINFNDIHNIKVEKNLFKLKSIISVTLYIGKHKKQKSFA